MSEANNQACQWKYCESEDSWDTQCDNKYVFMNDGPKENDYKFCPGCGKPVALAGDREPTTSKTPGESALASATGSASLCEALDDGQEVEMYKLEGKSKGYQVRIHGDCWHESDPHPTLDAAINQVSKKYSAWKNSDE